VAEQEFLGSRADIRPWTLPDYGAAGTRVARDVPRVGATSLDGRRAQAARTPGAAQLRDLGRPRHRNAPSPLLIVVLHPGADGSGNLGVWPDAAIAGTRNRATRDQVERIAATALPSPTATRRSGSSSGAPGSGPPQTPGSPKCRSGRGRTSYRLACRLGHELADGVRPRRSLPRDEGRRSWRVSDFRWSDAGRPRTCCGREEVATAVAVFLEADENTRSRQSSLWVRESSLGGTRPGRTRSSCHTFW